MPTDTQHSHSDEQQQMDAVVIQASGPPAQSLAYRSEPVPEPGPGEVLIEVHDAAEASAQFVIPAGSVRI